MIVLVRLWHLLVFIALLVGFGPAVLAWTFAALPLEWSERIRFAVAAGTVSLIAWWWWRFAHAHPYATAEGVDRPRPAAREILPPEGPRLFLLVQVMLSPESFERQLRAPASHRTQRVADRSLPRPGDR